MNCTRCDGTGYLNTHQLHESVDARNPEAVQAWLDSTDGSHHDVQVCDCCGDGESHYGTPGKHYTSSDPRGEHGPYAGNGGYAHCH